MALRMGSRMGRVPRDRRTVGDMIGRSWRAILMAATLVAVALPTVAQDATSSVRFDGVGFVFDHGLGRSVNITRVPHQPLNGIQVGEPSPAHIAFSLYQRQGEAARIPGIWDAPGVVRVYRTSALEGYPIATAQLTRLRRLLTERPDPSSLEAIAAGYTTDSPYLPIEEAAQAIAAHAQYIDTPELSGVAYVTGFRQDYIPFTRDDLWYTFQGLSTDGRWYVAVRWVLRAGMFPTRVSDADSRRVGRNDRTWARYIAQSSATLDAAEPTAFEPSLDTVDALVRSIDFDSVVQSTASASVAPMPSLSPIPSPAPSPAGPMASTTP
jgi:hypothetical protein